MFVVYHHVQVQVSTNLRVDYMIATQIEGGSSPTMVQQPRRGL